MGRLLLKIEQEDTYAHRMGRLLLKIEQEDTCILK